jgi:arabinose-5-phosphate isomerase
MQLAMGDALAIALLEARGFTAQDFRLFHPGGKLGAQLAFVRDVMHSGEAMPLASLEASMEAALIEMTGKRLGCVVIADARGKLAGIVTDGDLRRHLRRAEDWWRTPARSIMTPTPITIAPDAMAAEALALLNETKRTVLIVVDAARMPVGVVHLHDLYSAGVA